MITAPAVADCAPGVSVPVSSAVSNVLLPLRDAIGGAAIVVAAVDPSVQQARAATAGPIVFSGFRVTACAGSHGQKPVE